MRNLKRIIVLLAFLVAMLGTQVHATTNVVTMDESGMYVTGNARGEYASELKQNSHVTTSFNQPVTRINPIGFSEIFKFSIGAIIGCCIVCLFSLGGSGNNYAY